MDWLVIVGVGFAGFVLGWIARATRSNSSDAADFNKVQRGAVMPNLSPTSMTGSASSPVTPEDLGEYAGNWANIDALIRKGKKIEAIKAYRQATSSGLKEAKDAVEARERDLKRAP